MNPSLDSAYKRVKRAKQNLTRFKRERTDFWRSTSPISVPRNSTGTFEDTSLPPVPTILSILIGECIYNLRAALDYLIYELAILDSGKVHDGTQFPIFDDITGWQQNLSHRRPYLKGVSGVHKAQIERLQPYSGCKWTAILRDISNPDKHRRLTDVEPNKIVEIKWNACDIAFEADTSSVTTENVDSNLSLRVSFDDGSDVVDTLNMIISEVFQVLNGFKPEFS